MKPHIPPTQFVLAATVFIGTVLELVLLKACVCVCLFRACMSVYYVVDVFAVACVTIRLYAIKSMFSRGSKRVALEKQEGTMRRRQTE